MTIFLFLLGFLVLLVYLATMPPGLYWGDGIELTTSAYLLGIPHPTGYALYMLFGKLFSIIPWSSVAWRLHFFSVVCTLASTVLFFFLIRLTGMAVFPPRAFGSSRYLSSVVAAFALAFAFSHTVWRLGTVAEVYALHLLFLVAIMYLSLLCIVRKKTGHCVLLILVLAMSFTHHMMVLTALPFVAVAVAHLRLRELKASTRIRLLLLMIVVIAIVLCSYLYFPIRASQKPPLNWGNPATFSNFLWVVSGGEFREFYFLKFPAGIPITGARVLPYLTMRLDGIFSWLCTEFLDLTPFGIKARVLFVLFVLLFLGSGVAYLFARLPAFAAALCLNLVLTFSLIFLYGIYDIEDYFISLVPGLLLLAFVGSVMLLNIFETYTFRRKINYANWVFFIIPLLMLSAHFNVNDRHDDITAELYGQRLLNALPPNTLLITLGDSDIYPLWYLTMVEGQRPDVLVVGGNFIYSPWYATFFNSENLHGRSIHIEKRPIASEASFYQDLSRWIIEPNIDRFPVFITKASPFLQARYNVKPVAQLLTQKEYEQSHYPFMPPPYLFRIHKAK